MGTRTVGTGWGWEQSLRGRGGDGGQVCGDGVAMGTGTTVTVGDGDELLSPCSSLVCKHHNLSLIRVTTKFSPIRDVSFKARR